MPCFQSICALPAYLFPPSWLPGLLVYHCWSTPTLMVSDNQQLWGITDPVSPQLCGVETGRGAGATSFKCTPSLSGQSFWQLWAQEERLPRSNCDWEGVSGRVMICQDVVNHKSFFFFLKEGEDESPEARAKTTNRLRHNHRGSNNKKTETITNCVRTRN